MRGTLSSTSTKNKTHHRKTRYHVLLSRLQLSSDSTQIYNVLTYEDGAYEYLGSLRQHC